MRDSIFQGEFPLNPFLEHYFIKEGKKGGKGKSCKIKATAHISCRVRQQEAPPWSKSYHETSKNDQDVKQRFQQQQSFQMWYHLYSIVPTPIKTTVSKSVVSDNFRFSCQLPLNISLQQLSFLSIHKKRRQTKNILEV